ncbi:hypothetical protein [Tsukamurella soli]|uniref:hypothetical protein n=1 Tax=Tsukamurella soli TaxID=644556 RepID=UPI0031E6DDD3
MLGIDMPLPVDGVEEGVELPSALSRSDGDRLLFGSVFCVGVCDVGVWVVGVLDEGVNDDGVGANVDSGVDGVDGVGVDGMVGVLGVLAPSAAEVDGLYAAPKALFAVSIALCPALTAVVSLLPSSVLLIAPWSASCFRTFAFRVVSAL